MTAKRIAMLTSVEFRRHVHERIEARKLAHDTAELILDTMEGFDSDNERLEYLKTLRASVRGLFAIDCYRCRQWPCVCQDGITLLHADCVDVLHQLPQVDLILTDPPYGVSYISGRRHTKTRAITGDDGTNTFATAWARVLARLKPERYWYVFSGSRPDVLRSFIDIVGDTSQLLTWDKQNGGLGDVGTAYRISTESILFGWKGEKRGMRKIDVSVFRYPQASKDDTALHPAFKPVELLSEMIESTTDKNEIVFDPFVGAGSTLLAARRTGRKAIGIEVEERYCRIICRKLHDHRLFKVVR